jgi:hypothetical protein
MVAAKDAGLGIGPLERRPSPVHEEWDARKHPRPRLGVVRTRTRASMPLRQHTYREPASIPPEVNLAIGRTLTGAEALQQYVLIFAHRSERYD